MINFDPTNGGWHDRPGHLAGTMRQAGSYDSSGINPGGQSYGQMPQGQMQRPMYGQALMGQQYPMGGLVGMLGRW